MTFKNYNGFYIIWKCYRQYDFDGTHIERKDSPTAILRIID